MSIGQSAGFGGRETRVMTGWQIIEDDEIKDPLAQGTKKYDVLDPGPSTHIKSDLQPGDLLPWHYRTFPHSCEGAGTDFSKDTPCRQYVGVDICLHCSKTSTRKRKSKGEDKGKDKGKDKLRWCDHYAHDMALVEEEASRRDWERANNNMKCCSYSQNDAQRGRDFQAYIRRYLTNPVKIVVGSIDRCNEGECNVDSESTSTSTIKPDGKELIAKPSENPIFSRHVTSQTATTKIEPRSVVLPPTTISPEESGGTLSRTSTWSRESLQNVSQKRNEPRTAEEESKRKGQYQRQKDRDEMRKKFGEHGTI